MLLLAALRREKKGIIVHNLRMTVLLTTTIGMKMAMMIASGRRP
ncbi:MAG: hypothetical protein ACI4B3_00535 [Prevotella sp.]